MGNLFMGFPVPRAKIAEMIEGTAPPTIHVINHLPDGSDPIALPGDIAAGQLLKWDGTKFIGVAEPAGGIATRYADPNIFHATNFESLDGFEVYTSGGATVSIDHDFLWLQTGDTINHLARCRKAHAIRFPLATWNNARAFRCYAWLYTATNKYGVIFIGTGYGTTNRHVAFTVEDGMLKGSVHNGTSQITVDLEELAASTYGVTRHLEARFTPGVKAEFYIGGYKIDEIATGLPAGSTDAKWWFYSFLKNTDGTNDLWLRVSQFEFTQAL